MEYTKQTWTAPTGTGLSRYAKSGETDTHIELALDPVNLTNTPTPVTVARLNHMEEGIAKAYDTAPPTPWAQYSGKDLDVIPEIVLDESYHYRHLINNAVVPTPHGLYFNGTSYLRSKDKVTLPDVFTFSATVNCNKKTTTQGIFCIGQYNTPTVPFFWLARQSATSDNLNILVSNGTTHLPAITFTNFFTGFDNIDVNLSLCVDFIAKTIYVHRNNIMFGSVVSSPTMVKPSSDYAYIGRSVNNTEYLLGYMRNIQLFDASLTDTQRNWLAQGNTPPILYDVTNYELEGAEAISDSLVGMIAAFSGTADFSNWLFCDGRAVSRTQYAKLFARIGITWGAGDTTTTFNLPDLREVTLVGAGDSPRTMTDPDVFTVAQFKDATFKSHTHNYSRNTPLSPFIAPATGNLWSQNPDEATNNTYSSGSTVTRANSMGVGYFIRSL